MGKTTGMVEGNTASKYARKRVPISVIIATGITLALSPAAGKSISSAEPLVDTASSKAELVSSLFSKSESERTWSVDSIFSDVGIQRPNAREARARDNLLWLFSNSTDASQINDVVNDYFGAKGLNRRSLLLLGDVVGEIKVKGVPVVSPAVLVLHLVYVNGDSTSANLRTVPNSVFVVMSGLENTYDRYCGSGTGTQAATEENIVQTAALADTPPKAAPPAQPKPALARQNMPTDNTRVAAQPRPSKPAFAAKPKPRPVHAAVAKITKTIKDAKKKHHEHHVASIIRHKPAVQSMVAAAEPAKNPEPAGFAKFLAMKKKAIRYATYGIIAVIGLLGLGAGARALYLQIADSGREKKALRMARKVLLSNSMYKITPPLDFESITKRAFELAKKRRDKAGAKMFLRAIKAELKKGFLLSDCRMVEFSRKINSL